MRSTGGEAGGAAGRRTLTAVAVLIFAFLYLPVAVLFVYSFHEAKVFQFPPAGFSFKWYEELFNDRAMLQSIANSAIVASGVVPVTLLLGVPAAFALNRFEFPGKAVFERVVMLPLMIPGLITGLAILLVINHSRLSLSLFTIVIGHSVAWMPIVITQVYARLRRFDRRLEEASADLGAHPWQTFLRGNAAEHTHRNPRQRVVGVHSVVRRDRHRFLSDWRRQYAADAHLVDAPRRHLAGDRGHCNDHGLRVDCANADRGASAAKQERRRLTYRLRSAVCVDVA